ncbi:MAG: ABC-F family ATP-binding cassette domain-containing protein, partial [Pseudomonadota bacterium]
GGQRRRLALARAFAADPDILLLDEPTNHLDIAAIEALEARLKSFRGAMLVVSHDRRFLETVTTAIAWLRQGVVRAFDQGYKHFEPLAEQVEADEEKALDRLETKLKAEHRWLARGVTARRKRNQGRLRKLQGMRAERMSRRSAMNDAKAAASLVSETSEGASKLVIEAKGVSKAFDADEGPLQIVDALDLKIMRGDRVGVMGGNGAGKTTLLRLLLKQLEADQGRIRLAKNLEIAYLDQTRERLKPDDTLWETLAPLGGDHIMVRGASRHVASYAKDFMFTPAQLRQPVGALSGGERNRLTLALALAQPSNLLVLDEPTNDLDVETLDMLEDMLSEYDGTLIIVSHDRAFIDGVVTSLLTPQGDGAWIETPGGYADYLAQKTPAAAKPTDT